MPKAYSCTLLSVLAKHEGKGRFAQSPNDFATNNTNCHKLTPLSRCAVSFKIWGISRCKIRGFVAEKSLVIGVTRFHSMDKSSKRYLSPNSSDLSILNYFDPDSLFKAGIQKCVLCSYLPGSTY